MDIETYEKAGKLIEKIKAGKETIDKLTKIKKHNAIVPKLSSIEIISEKVSLSLPESIVQKSFKHILVLLEHEQEDFESDLRWL